MYKTLSALGVVLSIIFYGLYNLSIVSPTAIGTAVISEKPEKAIGGQAAVLLPENLSTEQSAILNTAYKIAKADGHKNPEVLQSLLLQETYAGQMKKYKVAGNTGDEYFGLGQIKLGPAKDIMRLYPDLWDRYKFHTRTDDELKANLILNPTFNIEIASKYLKLLNERYGYTGRTLLNAYNRGPSGVKRVDSNFHYAKGAEQKLASWKQKANRESSI